LFLSKKRKEKNYIIYVILSIEEGNNQTSSIKDKQPKDSDIIQDPNIIGRELFISEIKEFYPAVHIK
jgi:hypothetical protein